MSSKSMHNRYAIPGFKMIYKGPHSYSLSLLGSLHNSVCLRWCRIWSLVLFLLILLFGNQVIASGKAWDLSVGTFAQHNDNVPLVADETAFTGDEESAQYGFTASGSYRFYEGKQWDIGINGTISQTENVESDVYDYDHTSIDPSLFMARPTSAWQRPAHVTLTYNPKKDNLGGDDYEMRHTVSASLSVKNNPLWSTSLGYSFSDKDFDDEGVEPDRTSRDAQQHTISINFSREIPLWRTLGFGYSYTDNQADGSNFDFNSHNVSLSYKTPIFSLFLLEASASFSTQDYVNYTPEPRRSQDNWYYQLSIMRPLSRQLSVNASLNYVEYGGNEDEFDATRLTTGAGVNYRF